ncbi:uncharacterized protein LOC112181738 [Rosa chinensis]|uniref:uncharacterized protein LOC112181738 n=1 Tax=Rosa chinensis TaxID=74649 RepID=UPI001AD90ABC|nr:uncharacterized protein LOC112181738 [Rosa chinensis]
MALLLPLHPRTLTISLVLRTRRLQLLHLYSALFSHHHHPRDRGEKETLVILLEAAARVPCIRIMKVWIVLATLTHQSTTAAKKTMMLLKVGVLMSPSTTSITLRKMGVMMIRMEIIQTVLQEETGGRGHFITKSVNLAASTMRIHHPKEVCITLYESAVRLYNLP